MMTMEAPMNHPNDPDGSNDSANPHLHDLAAPARRRVLAGSVGAAALGVFAPALSGCATGTSSGTSSNATRTSIGFTSVPLGTDDAVRVPRGYTAAVLYAWGDPIDGIGPRFKWDASNSAEEQLAQAGMHHDGMHFFALPRGSAGSHRGLLCLNHEYVDQGLLFADGMENWSRDKVVKAIHAHGVSVIEIAREGQGWRVVPSRYARRITGATPMRIAGPAAGHRLMRTAADAEGRTALGTLNNCAHGYTPWGTYLTCEENFNGYFANPSGDVEGSIGIDNKPEILRGQSRYGITKSGFGYRWHEREERFDASKHPNEPHRFGWVVEIDPFDRNAQPVKHTALGRIKHEGAEVLLARDGRVVVYMGDDERNEYLYKFVSRDRFDATNAYDPKHRELLDHGTLYVARLSADGSGVWLPLVHGQNGLTPDNGFADQGEVLIKTRQAADRLGATMLDRPEWIAHHPTTRQMFVTLTNNSRRGTTPPSSNAADGTTSAGSARPAVDAPNPRSDNVFGHILSWNENGGDPAALAFRWEVFILAGNPAAADANQRGNIKGDAFGAPDGLWIDAGGVLWIQTDVSTRTLNRDAYAGMGNNQMLACNIDTREVRRFLVGPPGCEITGVITTPDRRTMFVNIQHPGETAGEGPNDPANPRRFSNWPDQRPDGRPRSATVVITKEDGGVIGT
jgi:hypothetical protein